MTILSTHAHTTEDNSSFDHFGATVRNVFDDMAGTIAPLFTTDVDPDALWSIYLDGFSDPTERQHHNCHCCRTFIKNYGNLVVIDEHGQQYSALWAAEGTPDLFRESVAHMARAVERSRVNGVFLAKEEVWGTPATGQWHHFHVIPSRGRLHTDRINTPYQAMAQKKQDFGTLSHGLADYDFKVVTAAMNLLQADALYRAEKVIGPAKFLFDLHRVLSEVKNKKNRENLIWSAVARAPVGFATPRSSMIGTLLDDLAAGLGLEAVKSKFAAKMHPLQYQRPTAAPDAGNIAQAEKLIEKLGLAPALRRRSAKIEECKLIWRPKPDEPAAAKGGVFDHLKKVNGHVAVDVPKQTITWVKFAASVLPEATRIQVHMKMNMAICGVVTAVDPDAPGLLQWDYEDERNPVSWYFYHGGTSPTNWKLPSHGLVDCTGVMLKPNMWSETRPHDNQGKGAICIIKGAQDQRPATLCLFPEILKADLHSVRKTIEAHSNRSKLEGRDEGSANGIMVGSGRDSETNIIRVTTPIGTVDYHIDRWD